MMSRIKALAILFLMLAISLVAGTRSTYSQGGDSAVPPQVIDIWPLPGVELLPTDTLTITFDQPMDHVSVETALQATPSLNLVPVWQDAQTLNVRPQAGWPREQTYTFTVDQRARAISGAALSAPYKFKVQTLGPLAVAEVSPAPNAEQIAADARIVVSFNRPVIALTADALPGDMPTPVQFEPTVAGKGEWVNASLYTFTPANPLALNTLYTAHIAALTSAEGAVMSDAYSWSFHTLPPQIKEIKARPIENDKSINYRVLLDAPVIITFSQPMDRASTEAAFSLSGEATPGVTLPGRFVWTEQNTILTFTPRQLLTLDTAYRAVLAESAQAASGGQLAKGAELSFRTVPYPAVTKTDPKNGEAKAWLNTASIAFNTVMNPVSFNNHVEIVPQVENPRVQYNDYWQELYVAFDAQPSTAYTITLKAGAADMYGNVIHEDYTFSYTTRAPFDDPNQPVFSPLANGDLVTTSADRADTSIAVEFTHHQTVKMQLYRITPAELATVRLLSHQYTYEYGVAFFDGYRCAPPDFVKPANLIREWTEPLDPGTADAAKSQHKSILLASDKGGKLPVGFYWITMGDTHECMGVVYDKPEHGPQYQFGLAVVTANITMKRGPEDVLVWLTNLADTAPLPGAKVTIYSEGKALASGITDSDGVVKVPVRVLEHRGILITAEGPGVYAAWHDLWEPGWRRFGPSDNVDERPVSDPSDLVGYLYTDRGVYRPGDTVYYRGILRQKRDMQFPVPENRTVYVRVGSWAYSPDQPILAEQKVTLNDFGTFSGAYQIPADAPTGTFSVWATFSEAVTAERRWGGTYYVQDASVDFVVADYRAADFAVHVTAQQPVIFQGDALNATVQGLYYSGGAVSNASVQWKTYVRQASFKYTGAGQYTFGEGYSIYGDYYYSDYDYSYYNERDLSAGTSHTDSNGEATILTAKTTSEDYTEYSPLTIIVEGTLNDESGQPVSGRTEITAYPSNLFIGVHASSAGKVDQPYPVDLIAVDASSQIRPGQALELSLDGYAWNRESWGNWEHRQTVAVTTGADGGAHYSFPALPPGLYTLKASGRDEQGRPNVTFGYFWISEPGNTAYAWGDPRETIKLLADRRDYQPGDVADILIPAPFSGPATVMVAAERAGVLSYEILHSDGQTIHYRLPITDAFAPTVYVTATFITPIDATTPYPKFMVSQAIQLNVTPVRPILNVRLTPSTRQAKPGETVKFDVLVTDSEGKPVRAEVGLALVDKAVLDLLPPALLTLEKAFFGKQEDFTYTELSVDGLLEAIEGVLRAGSPGFGGGGAGGSGLPNLRQHYLTTPLWAAHVLTDADGRVQVSVTLPDNLTTWQLDARALTDDADLKIGEATTEITTSLPLIIRPITPRFLVVGDRVELAAIVQNNTDQAQAVQVSLAAKGVTLQSPVSLAIRVLAGERKRVTWWAVVQDSAGADLAFNAIGDGIADAAKPALATGPEGTIPIYHYSVPDAPIGVAGLLRGSGSRAETIVIPARLHPDSATIAVTLAPSLVAPITDSFTYLQQYPYFCIEQTVSRFLPNLSTYQALRTLNIQDATLEANLRTQLDAALDKLRKEQKPDGSWGWYPGMDSDPLTTAYVALALIEAHRAGFSIDAALYDSALNYVQGQAAALPVVKVEDWRLNRQAFYLYVLAQGSKSQPGQYEALFTQRARLSSAARAYLLMAYQARFPGQPALKTLTSDLLSLAVIAPTGIHWQEQTIDWWNWGSDTRTTALVLAALIRTMPDSPLLPDVVRWLMLARRGNHWATTQETVWAITALTDWLLHTGELRGTFAYSLSFNREVLNKGSVTPENIRTEETLHLAVKDLLATNRLVIARGEGEGVLYYNAQLDLRIPAASAAAISRGVSVQRAYVGADLKTPITTARLGDVVTVQLTITVPQNLRYFALEDTLPAGLEPIDTALQTTSLSATGPSSGAYPGDDAAWGWWWFKEADLRDVGLNLYADFLPRGTYIYTYQARASTPGVFQTIPTHAFTFYNADVFGRSAGTVFTVQPVTPDFF